MLLILLLHLFDITSGSSNYRDCWPPCKSSLIWEDEQKTNKMKEKEQESQTGQKSRAAIGTAGGGEQRSFIGTREPYKSMHCSLSFYAEAESEKLQSKQVWRLQNTN